MSRDKIGKEEAKKKVGSGGGDHRECVLGKNAWENLSEKVGCVFLIMFFGGIVVDGDDVIDGGLLKKKSEEGRERERVPTCDGLRRVANILYVA